MSTRGRQGDRQANTPQKAQLLETSRLDSTLVLTLARPEARNSLSEALIETLQHAIDDAAQDATVRAIIIAAKGSVFSAGHDLKELTAHREDADGGRAFTKLLMRQCSKLMRSVEGTATAAGCQLVASCDLAVASEKAEFGTPGVNIGLFCSTPMVALSRNVPRKQAMQMLLLGERMGAHDAATYGLVNKVVAPGKAMDGALEMARVIAAKPQATLAIGKEAFYRQLEMSLADAYDYASGVMVENMMHAESKEGIGAFIEKRDPDWTKT
jgi:enoyl-CoA hydratase/carnithine racemase